MKKLLPLLLCLLLCGCAREAARPEVQNPTIPAATVAYTQPQVLSDAEEIRQGTLTIYPLSLRKVRSLRAMGEDLLVLAGRGNTTLARLSGEPLTAAAILELDFELDGQELQVWEDCFAFYDPQRRQMRVLDRELTEIRSIAVTEPVQGRPYLTADQKTLYYCTASAILAWDLESGIHRTVAELSYDAQELAGLHLEESVLQCRIRDGAEERSLFLAAADGRLLSQQSGDVTLLTEEMRYYAALPVSALQLLVFGKTGSMPQVLYPDDTAADCFFLPRSDGAVTVSVQTDDCPKLSYFDLSSGTLRAELTLEPLQIPKAMDTDPEGNVWFLRYDPALDQDQLCCWKVSDEIFLPDTEHVYTGAYSGTDPQSPETLQQCQETARQLGEAYGITVHIGADALEIQPWDYTFEAETLPQILSAELELLDQRLSQYPEAILRKTASHFTSLNLCLVRSITGTAESGSLDSATGIQFLDGTDAYVVITVGQYSRQALYHELFHAMEIHIFAKSIALDQWNLLNPPDFYYSFGSERPESFEKYLSGAKRAFVDAYSMTYPKEDRARIWEYAMLPGNAELFDSESLQSKLTALCKSVREAYGLKKSAETFPWEQYLKTPLAYSG